MATQNSFHLRLDLERKGESIDGRLHDEQGREFEFSGWVGLAAALEAVSQDAPCRIGKGATRRPLGD